MCTGSGLSQLHHNGVGGVGSFEFVNASAMAESSLRVESPASEIQLVGGGGENESAD